MNVKRGLNKFQKRALQELLLHTADNFFEKADLCLVASGHKHHKYVCFDDRKLLEKVYLPAFDKIGLKFMPPEGIKGYNKQGPIPLVFTRYSIYTAVKRFNKERTIYHPVDWDYVQKYFPKKEEWIPYLIPAIRNNPPKLKGPCMNQKTIDDAKLFHKFIKKEFPKVDELKREYFRMIGYF